jgi:UDP-glucose 4-epimerase
MRAVVTGGAGFIGSNIVAELVARGDEVVVVDDLSSGHRQNLVALGERITLVEGDVSQAGVCDDACAGADVVFHLAASVGNQRSISDPVRDSEVNVIGTIRVMEAARRHGIPKVVVSSSAGVFGELKTLPIDESHPIDPITPYGVSKLAEERMALAYAHMYGIEAVALRYFNVFGPHQRFDAYGNVIPIFAHRMLHGEPLTIFGDGEQTRDFVYVGDVVQANLRSAAARGVSGVFNIGSATQITVNRLVELMQQAFDIEATVVHAGPRAGDVRDSLADISAARSAFDFSPSPDISAGLAVYAAWALEALR